MKCKVSNFKEQEDGSALMDVEYDEEFLALARKAFPNVEDEQECVNAYILEAMEDHIKKSKEVVEDNKDADIE